MPSRREGDRGLQRLLVVSPGCLRGVSKLSGKVFRVILIFCRVL